MDLTNSWQTVLTSIAASGIAYALLRSSLERTLSHTYDRKLAAFKDELELAQKQKLLGLELSQKQKLLEFQDVISKANALHSNAHAAFAAGQKAAMERRLDAIATLWMAVVALRPATPLIVRILETADNEKVAELGSLEKYKILLQMDLSKFSDITVDAVRPFVGENLWLLFQSYSGVITMKGFLISTATTMREVVEANRSPYLDPVVKSALSDQEYQEFTSKAQGKWAWFALVMEAKIAAAAEDVISGREFGTASVTETVRISESIAKVTGSKMIPNDLAL